MTYKQTRIIFLLAAAATLGAVVSMVADGVALLNGGAEDSRRDLRGALSAVPAAVEAGIPEDDENRRSGGAAILARNIFDSSSDRAGSHSSGAVATGCVGALAPCAGSGIRAFATVTDADPNLSRVLLSEGDGKPMLAAEGDCFADRVVERIGWRYVLLEAGDGGSCYVDLYGIDDVVYQPVDRPELSPVRGDSNGI